MSDASKQRNPRLIHFLASDGVEITGDLYMVNNEGLPFIILCHQAGYSRGEYTFIATELNRCGFNCLAIDLRSGYAYGGIKNATHQSALSKGKTTGFVESFHDMVAALDYVEVHYEPRRIILWGSSYTSSLAIILASMMAERVYALVAFSPGEYFQYDGKSVADHAKNVRQRVFIASSKDEVDKWKDIASSICRKDSVFFIPKDEGAHGSSALFEGNPNNKEYWKAVLEFLNEG